MSAPSHRLYVASFLLESEAVLYTASALVGAAAALTWTAQGNYLTLVSAKSNMTRNSGLFWAIFMCR